jgi:hypothetical protein
LEIGRKTLEIAIIFPISTYPPVKSDFYQLCLAPRHHDTRAIVAIENYRPFVSPRGEHDLLGDDSPKALTGLMCRRRRHVIGNALDGAESSAVIGAKHRSGGA